MIEKPFAQTWKIRTVIPSENANPARTEGSLNRPTTFAEILRLLRASG
jgi:hypothetical protein